MRSTQGRIRLADEGDLPRICAIYEAARAFMREHGNPGQWGDAYPSIDDARRDLAQEALWVLCPEEGPAVAVASVLPGPDPTYREIDGAWLDDGPYWVLHRLAVGVPGRGFGREVLNWFAEGHRSCRVDTAHENLPMQGLVESCGFTACGTITLPDGSPRIAYQRVSPETE